MDPHPCLRLQLLLLLLRVVAARGTNVSGNERIKSARDEKRKSVNVYRGSAAICRRYVTG